MLENSSIDANAGEGAGSLTWGGLPDPRKRRVAQRESGKTNDERETWCHRDVRRHIITSASGAHLCASAA